MTVFGKEELTFNCPGVAP